MRIKSILVAGLAVISAGAYASSITVAGTLGAYFPSSSEIRNIFGNALYSFGATPWGGYSTKGGFSPEIGLISGGSGVNTFYVAPVAVAYEKDFPSSSEEASTPTPSTLVPYLRASLGVAYFNYDITRVTGSRYTLSRLGGTAGFEAGVKISSRAKVFLKYDKFTTEQHFDFSGLQVGVVVALFKL